MRMSHENKRNLKFIRVGILLGIYIMTFNIYEIPIYKAYYIIFVLMVLGEYLAVDTSRYTLEIKLLNIVYTVAITLLGYGIIGIFVKKIELLYSLGIFISSRLILNNIIPRAGHKVKKTLIFGEKVNNNSLLEAIRKREKYKLIGVVGSKKESIGSKKDILEIIERYEVDEIVVNYDIDKSTESVKNLLTAKLEGTKVTDYATFMEELEEKIDIGVVDYPWMIKNRGFDILNDNYQKRAKRFADIILFLVLLIPAGVVSLLFAGIIKLDGVINSKNKGPLFFKQERVGLGGKNFELIKFRTMITKEYWNSVGMDPNFESWTIKGDPRVTALGKFMRATRIDELPQLINVFKNEMSFIGPRPESAEYVKILEKEIPFYSIRHTVLPGLTGWAQVKYPYGSNIKDSIAKLEYDLYYIKHQNLGLDSEIFFKTIKTVISSRGR